MSARPVCLLGPQRLEPNLRAAVDSHGLAGNIAAVTAGWEERELEDGELRDHLGGRAINLEIHRRGEEVYRADPELHRAMLARHDHLRARQELHRLRLAHELDATRELLRRSKAEPESALLREASDAALASVRRLDAEHVERIAAIHVEFEARWHPFEREHVARHRDELRALLADAEALCVAGGHVTVLLNRVRLFGLLGLRAELPVFAWSAGAMVLGERVVLFHDSPPQGFGNPEVLESGLGVYQGIVALPHADRRLRLDDPTRVELFARRFAPARCVALVSGSRLDWDGARWHGQVGTQALGATGELVEVGAEEVAR